MSDRRTCLVAGLGNPGGSYARTRHNAGFIAIDRLAEKHQIALSSTKFDTQFGRGSIEEVAVILAKPMAFMNQSGPPLQKLAAYFRIALKDTMIVHDDIDLDFGRLKIKQKGGHGGHKGIKSIMEAFGGDEFTRIRIGIGRPDTEKTVTHHVLGIFKTPEAQRLDQITRAAGEAVVTVLSKGTVLAMNRFNEQRTVILPELSDGG